MRTTIALLLLLASCATPSTAPPATVAGLTAHTHSISHRVTHDSVTGAHRLSHRIVDVLPAPEPTPVPAPAPLPTTTHVGGFIEATTSTAVRTKLTRAQLVALLPPAGGSFVFPAPYSTQAVRITDASSCPGGGDCVRYGYSYWSRMSNHVGLPSMWIVLGLSGPGVSLWRYTKDTGKLDALGPIFTGTGLDGGTGETVYFSGTKPNALYLTQGSRLLRFDVTTKLSETVFDVAAKHPGAYLYQAHSSRGDDVHSATLRANNTGTVLGCILFRADTGATKLFPPRGSFDECQVDQSGDWLVVKQNADGRNGEDNTIINTRTFAETTLLDENGAAGHSDNGFGVLVAEDNFANLGGTVRAWKFGQTPLTGTVVYHDPAWRTEGSTHVTHRNAKPDALPSAMACESTASRADVTRGSEIYCFNLSGDLRVMVVAPSMVDLNAAGGVDGDYGKSPFGVLDVTGRYLLWTSNAGGDRLDAFLLRVPGLL